MLQRVAVERTPFPGNATGLAIPRCRDVWRRLNDERQTVGGCYARLSMPQAALEAGPPLQILVTA
jgi:hypothetical protein